MKLMTSTCFAAFGLLAAGPVWAQATDEGAAELLAILQTYLGSTEGVVSVAVDGDAYAATVDLAPLITTIPVEGVTANVSPIVIAITDNGDGTWDYVIDQPVSFGYDVPGQTSMTSDYASVVVEGVFDEALGDSSEYHAEFSGATSQQTQTDPMMGEVAIKTAVESMVWDGGAVAGADGLDASFTGTTTGITYDFTMPMGEGMPGMEISASIAEGTAEGTMTGYQPAGIYGLIAWFVAHPDAALIEADKAGLKGALTAALPLFGNLSVGGSYSTIAVTTPMGVFGLDEVGVAVEANGVVADGLFREAISLKGLTLPDGIAPPFALPLIPDEMAFDVAVSSFDLAAAAQLALGLLDLPVGTEPPEGFEMQLLSALMPDGTVDVKLAPGVTMNEAYTLTYEGAMTAGMGGMPVGTAKVTLAGIDAIMAALNEAPPEMSGQIIPVLGMAQAMGTPGPAGELVWEIDASTPGSLKVNGMDMMAPQ